MNVAILGATRGMGRALVRLFAERGDSVVLLGRDSDELEKSAADVRARSKSGAIIATAHCDLHLPATFASSLDAAATALGKIDAVVVTAAMFATQDKLESDTELARELLTVNLANTIAFCEHARKRLLAQGGGTLCVFSSVAGDRGRKPVAIYGASKAGLSHYLESVDNRWRAEGLRVVTIKPGFVKTGMTAGLKPPPFAGEPEQVASDVVRAIDRGTPVIYSPSMWRWVMLIIRNLPRLVMRRINF